MSNRIVTGPPGAHKIEYICDRCDQQKKGPPIIHPWSDRHPATKDEMCKDCFREYLKDSDHG